MWKAPTRTRPRPAPPQVIRALRLALRGGDWSTIEGSVAAAQQLRAAGGLAPWSESEVKHASAEVADRRIQVRPSSECGGGEVPVYPRPVPRI